MKEPPPSDAVLESRRQLFQGTTALFILAPLVGELSIYFFTGELNASLPASIATIMAAALIYLAFHRSGCPELGLRVAAISQMLCFLAGILINGGLHADQFVYLPLFPVLYGLLFGARAALLTGAIMAVFCAAIALLSGHISFAAVAREKSSALLAFQWIEATVVAACAFLLVDRTRRREELSDQKKLLDVVLSHLPTMVFVKDSARDLRFKLFNKAGQDLLGVQEGEILGKNDYDLFPKDQADFFTKMDKEVFVGHRTVRIDQEPISTPRGQRWLRTYKVPTYQANGSPDLLIGISTDITEEIEMQKTIELERAKALHNAKLASLGEMAAGIAHEINNPLAIISGNAHLLKELGADPAIFEAKIEAMLKATERIQKIVKGMRKFSRTTEGRQRNVEQLAAIIAETLVIAEPNAKKHDVRISTEVAQGLELFCDGVEIEQVLVNLVNNGIDAVKTAEERWVKIVAFAEGQTAVLQVLDSGRGIPDKIERKLFQPFFTTKEVGEGTGLGLSIAKGILEQHNAKINLNAGGANTCFEIRFPLAAPATSNIQQ